MDSIEIEYKKYRKKIGSFECDMFDFPNGLLPEKPYYIESFLFIKGKGVIYPRFFQQSEPFVLKYSETPAHVKYCYFDIPQKGLSTIIFSIPDLPELDIHSIKLIYYFGEVLSPGDIDKIFSGKLLNSMN